MLTTKRLFAHEHVMAVRHGKETVLLDVIKERYYSLHDPSGELWPKLCDGASLDDLVATTLARYDVSLDMALDDLRSVLTELLASNLIRSE